MSFVEHLTATTDRDAARLGGKGSGLAFLLASGVRIPPAFVVTAEGYRHAVSETVRRDVARRLVALPQDIPTDELESATAEIRRRILDATEGHALSGEVQAALSRLREASSAGAELAVAVRSSSIAEDAADKSFAGEHDTYLWVRGVDTVVEHVRRCWASLFTDRAIAYRRRMGYTDDGAAMSVGVQKMVLPRTSGVAFTLNPTNGDRSQVAIDAAWGLGEAVVSGSVTPDNFLVDKVMGDITSRTISSKHVEHRLGPDDAVVEADVEPERRDAPCLTDAEIRAVAALARRAERHYKCPQDVEWALDSQLPDGENVLLLQSRPETVWSRRRRTVNGVSADTYQSIVHNLLHPVGSTAVDTHSH